MGAYQRLSARDARSGLFVAEFGAWLQAQRLRISAKSRLGEKLTYIHRQWGGQQTFIDDGRVDPDAYLKACLEAISADHPASRIGSLLPWDLKPSADPA